MTATEQKIEQLLLDLNEAVYEDGGSLHLYTEGTKDILKGIVQAFVDSFKDEDKLRPWEENQQNAYKAFIKAGIPSNWAKVMSDRVVDHGWEVANPNAPSMLEHFADWGETPEGPMLWYDLALAVRLDGVDAFSKFQCPK